MNDTFCRDSAKVVQESVQEKEKERRLIYRERGVVGGILYKLMIVELRRMSVGRTHKIFSTFIAKGCNYIIFTSYTSWYSWF